MQGRQVFKFVLSLLFFCFAAAVMAESREESCDSCLSKASHMPALAISVEKEAYRLGETIPVTLTFTNDSDNDYYVLRSTYNRSGRLNDIAFCIDSQGHTDPLVEYFSRGIFLGGGLSQVPGRLGQYSQVFDMNEWVRFDAPGTYEVYVSTTRVLDEDGRTSLGPVCSQAVTLRILAAGEDFNSGVLEEALDGLSSVDEEQRHQGARQLRFLGTPQAVDVLVSLLGDENHSVAHEAFLGIIGFRDWSYAEKVLLEKIDDPDVVVNETYVSAFGLVSMPRGDLPAKETEGSSSPQQATITFEKLQACGLIQEKFQAKALARLTKAINAKKGRALAVSSQLLRDRGMDAGLDEDNAVQTFLHLSILEQEDMLKDDWDKVRSPKFEPLFKEILEDPSFIEEYGMDQWEYLGFASLVLLRYAELNPEAARKMILEDIQRPYPRFSGEILCSLPDTSLPEVEDVLLRHLLAKEWTDLFKIAPLIGRYATAKILPQVVAFYQKKEGRWPGDIRDGILEFWIKHDLKNGLAALERSVRLSGRRGGSWRTTLRILLSHEDPAVRDLLTSLSVDSNASVAKEAKKVLEQMGKD